MRVGHQNNSLFVARWVSSLFCPALGKGFQEYLTLDQTLVVIQGSFVVFYRSCFNSEVEAKGSEVLANTQATISCVVKGLTEELNAVAWQKPGGSSITNGADGYVIADGTYDSGSKTQTTVLTIPAAENSADQVYTCVITSTEHGQTEHKTDVNSNVFSKCKGKY